MRLILAPVVLIAALLAVWEVSCRALAVPQFGAGD